jgi:hypothetical protein
MLACNAGTVRVMFARRGDGVGDDVGTSSGAGVGLGLVTSGGVGVGVGEGDVTTFRSRCRGGFRGTTAKLAGQNKVASRSRLTEVEIRF